MSKPQDDLLSPCSSCDRETWHDIMFKHVDSEHEYRIDMEYYVVRCKGCRTVSFRKAVYDYEAAYPIAEDEWKVPEEIDVYPRVLIGHKELADLWDVPNPVRAVYLQSLRAIRDEANILAGIGLRATIEAICNERNIIGRTLDKRIDSLMKTGLISQKDAERLHAIRFLGNDAAHEVRHSSSKSILIALRIIEHLLVNIYILDSEVDARLDTIIKKPEDFLKVLDEKLKSFSTGDEVPIAKLFGKDVRRLHGSLATHQSYLMAEVSAGTYSKLKIGKVDNYAGSKDKLQHFIVS